MCLDDGKLIYVKDRCTPEDMARRFFVKVVPVNPEDLPADHRWWGRRFHWLWSKGAAPERFGDRCVAGKSLPTYPVDHVVTGQRVRRWQRWQRRIYRVLWEAEAALGAGG